MSTYIVLSISVTSDNGIQNRYVYFYEQIINSMIV